MKFSTMRAIKRHMILICTIPGLLIILGIMLYFLSQEPAHSALNMSSEPVDGRVVLTPETAPAPLGDRQAVEPESLRPTSTESVVYPALSSPSEAAPVSTSFESDEQRRARLRARLNGTSKEAAYLLPSTWAKADPAFEFCVRSPNGPWLLIPADALEGEVDLFKALTRPILVEFDRRSRDLEARYPVTEPSKEYERLSWDLEWWRQEQCALAFKMTWPNARQPDPVVRR